MSLLIAVAAAAAALHSLVALIRRGFPARLGWWLDRAGFFTLVEARRPRAEDVSARLFPIRSFHCRHELRLKIGLRSGLDAIVDQLRFVATKSDVVRLQRR
jgi:hypothetical protein